MDLNLHLFGSLFELSAALNFTYAGSEQFRHGLTEGVLWSSKTITPKIRENINKYIKLLKEDQQKLIVLASENYGTASFGDIQKRIDVMNNHLNNDVANFEIEDKLIRKKEHYSRQFYKGLQSSFLYAGLFCLFILLLEGFEQFYPDVLKKSFLICLSIFNFSSIVFLAFYVRSLFSNWLSKPVKSFYVLTIWLIFILVSIKIALFFPGLRDSTSLLFNPRVIITWACLNAYMPFITHLARVFGRKFNYRWIKYKLWQYKFFCLYKIRRFEINEVEYIILKAKEVITGDASLNKNNINKTSRLGNKWCIIPSLRLCYKVMGYRKIWEFFVFNNY